MHHLDPHERPPDGIRNVYKKYQKMGLQQLNQDTEIIDIRDRATASSNSKLHVVKQHEVDQLTATFRAFAGQDVVAQDLDLPSSIPVYEHEDMPGRIVFFALLRAPIEYFELYLVLSQAIHINYLNLTVILISTYINSNYFKSSISHLYIPIHIHIHPPPSHKTTPNPPNRPPHPPHPAPPRNPIPSSIPPPPPRPLQPSSPHKHPYSLQPDLPPFPIFKPLILHHPPKTPTPIAHPLNPTIHTALPIHPLLTKKLRWTTLGGQYDWTLKCYPPSAPPPFPADIRQLLEDVFPQTRAEAAIVNLYSPRDTLSLHRDVAETSATGLVSVSLGCDAVFVVGAGTSAAGGEEKILTLRLRSGSALYMSGASRFAWHGVPQIVVGTCPEYLKDWPGTADGAGKGEYEEWKGWMANKRVNLNVRQMWD
ncbi:alkylated dna repair protein [Pyrenophora teres f. teres]|uniref:mRNA N(6)-methyladenine demethylase n=1 Tax=Pyrenophora teres f. teres TaxID=97479 RepID=A0A6S6WFD3_9PLEO|nr:alkylated dna repair protein [Pyrenophora teres f. teres]